MNIKILLKKLVSARTSSLGPGVGEIDEKTKLMSKLRVFYG
jgi:hypothetical protein